MINGKVYYQSARGCLIKPKKILYLGKKYEIVFVHPSYNIEKYYIIVNNKHDNIFEDLILSNCFHPNSWHENIKSYSINLPPKFSKYCLPDWVYNKCEFIDSKIHKQIISKKIPTPKNNVISDWYIKEFLLGMWNLDNPHHEPEKDFVITIPKLPFHF